MKRGLAAILAVTLLFSVVAPAVAGTAAVDFGADAAQDPFIENDFTKATHEMSWGTNDTAAVKYEDNSGEVTTPNASLNDSEDVDDLGAGTVNPYSFTVSDINASDFGEFPHNKDDVSALEASEWTTDGANTAGSISVSDTTTAQGVDAVQISTSSQSSTDKAVATFSNFSITSDAEKRYVQVGGDVSTLDSGTSAAIRYKDADGDFVEANISSSLTASNSDVIANGTGEGYLFQEQVGDMTVQGTGDGSMDEIQKVTVVVEDADITLDIMALNADKTGEWIVGTEYVDSDTDDDNLETSEITEIYTAGDISIKSLSTMGSTFDSATIHDLDMPLQFRASEIDPATDSRVNVSFENASNYPSFEHRQTAYYRLTMPEAYDLSYSNAELKLKMTVPEDRYKVLEVSEGIGDTNFTDVSSWSDVSGSTVAQGETASLDNTLQTGQEIGIHVETLNTADERDAILGASGGGGGQYEKGGGGGGLLGMILGAIGVVLSGSWLFGKRSSSGSAS